MNKKEQIFSNNATEIITSSGVYGILNKVNNKIYVGSGINLRRRYYEHSSYLRNKKHWIKELQNDYLTYGKENFEFIVLEPCKDFISREDYYIKLYINVKYNIYNSVDFSGGKLSEETKLKISKTLTGHKNVSKETYDRIKENHLLKNPNFYSDIAKIGMQKRRDCGEPLTPKVNPEIFKTKEFRDKISKISIDRAIKNGKKFICNETKQIFCNTGQCAREMNLPSYKCIWKVLKGILKSYKGFTFAYL